MFLALQNYFPDTCAGGVIMCADDTTLVPTHLALRLADPNCLEEFRQDV